MRIQFTPILYLRQDKAKKDGSCPVWVRFQRINGKEPKFPFGISVKPTQWDNTTSRPQNLALKIYADKKMARIEQQIYNAIANEVEFTHDLLRQFVSERDASVASSFFGFFDEYVRRQVERGKMRESTQRGYEVTRKLLMEYRPTIKIADINAQLLGGFDKFLVKRGQANNKGDVKGGRSNHHRHINAVLHYIGKRGVSVQNPYDNGDVEIPQAGTNDVFLELDELSRLVALMEDLPVGSTQYRVLCMFLFSCATGLRLGDARALKWEEVDVFSQPLILELDTQKTGAQLATPIPELGVLMIEYAPENEPGNVDYGQTVFHCNRYSPVTINKTLRKLAGQVGIDKHITYHCSRRTFITLALMQGADVHTLAKYVGHSNIQMTQQYAKWSKGLAIESVKKIELFRLKDILNTKSDPAACVQAVLQR